VILAARGRGRYPDWFSVSVFSFPWCLGLQCVRRWGGLRDGTERWGVGPARATLPWQQVAELLRHR